MCHTAPASAQVRVLVGDDKHPHGVDVALARTPPTEEDDGRPLGDVAFLPTLPNPSLHHRGERRGGGGGGGGGEGRWGEGR